MNRLEIAQEFAKAINSKYILYSNDFFYTKYWYCIKVKMSSQKRKDSIWQKLTK